MILSTEELQQIAKDFKCKENELPDIILEDFLDSTKYVFNRSKSARKSFQLRLDIEARRANFRKGKWKTGLLNDLEYRTTCGYCGGELEKQRLAVIRVKRIKFICLKCRKERIRAKSLEYQRRKRVR